MKLVLNSKVLAGLVIPAMVFGLSTAAGAQVTQAFVGTQGAGNPELAAADQRLDQVKSKVDQARKNLEIAKVMLKSAEAEFKSVRSDREALSLRIQAQQIADATTTTPSAAATTTPMNSDPNQVRQVVIPPVAGATQGTRLVPAQTQPGAQQQGGRIQPLDFNAQPQDQSVQPATQQTAPVAGPGENM